MNEPMILFRKSIDSEQEFEIAKKYFTIIEQRCEVIFNNLIIPRYSALPYYQELEKDIQLLGCRLINSYQQHRWIANFEYYEALKDYTFESWDDSNFYQCQDKGPFVVKGRTNSRKNQWNKNMFAQTKQDALKIAGELSNDLMIGSQGIIYRKYIPLKTFEYGINGLPFTNEWRFFYLGTQLLSYGYYWSNAEKVDYELPLEALNFADQIAEIVSPYCNFFVLDIAEREEGGWILVEINDGTCSGLSENNPETLYKNLSKELFRQASLTSTQ